MDVDAIRRDAASPVQAGRADVGAVAADLSDAFSDDVVYEWLLRPDAKRPAARLRYFKFVTANVVAGAGRIDRPAAGGAAAIWQPFEALNRRSLLLELKALPVMLHATSLSRFDRLMALRDTMHRTHPMDRPHAYLMLLGVSIALQGHGIGSRLLKAGTARLDAAGTPAYLETMERRNLPFYQQHGFEIILEDRARFDAPQLWGMWREPRSPA